MAKTTTEQKPKLSFKEKCKELDKQFKQVEVDRFYLPSGSIWLDWGLSNGKGYKSGRVYEFIAWEGGGKTTLAKHAAAECVNNLHKKVVYIDSEHAIDKDYAKTIGIDFDDKENIVLFQPDCGEDGFEYAKGMMETGEVGLVVLDSINGLLPRKQLEDPAGSVNLGLHARLIGQEIPKLKTLASKHNCVVIVISQVREKIGVMFGSPETTQGGNALKFWASGRIWLRKENDKEGTEIVGMYSNFTVVKNKIVSPYRKGKIPMPFGVGIDKLQEVIDLGKEFDILSTRAGVITYDNTKYSEEEFRDLLTDNPEFYTNIKQIIVNKLNGGENVEEEATEQLLKP